MVRVFPVRSIAPLANRLLCAGCCAAVMGFFAINLLAAAALLPMIVCITFADAEIMTQCASIGNTTITTILLFGTCSGTAVMRFLAVDFFTTAALLPMVVSILLIYCEVMTEGISIRCAAILTHFFLCAGGSTATVRLLASRFITTAAFLPMAVCVMLIY